MLQQKLRRRFLGSLMADLVEAGFIVDGSKSGEAPCVSPPPAASQIAYLRQIRDRQLQNARPFIARKESEGILSLFGDGATIDVSSILPELRICRSAHDHELFAYIKLFQRVPTTNRVGRQVRAIVYDMGQRSPVVLGVLALASSPYTLGCRDDYLEWRGSDRKAIKDAGLRRIMDLAVAMAAPPYNFLLGGKLIAALALAQPFRREIERRYCSQLLGVVTSSATGLHCPIFNRIGLQPGGLYRRIGETQGYTTVFASAKTLREARSFLPNFVSAPEGEFSVSVRPLHILRTALRRCGVPPDIVLRSGNPKGVYLGAMSQEDVVALRAGRASNSANDLSVEEVIAYWRNQILPKALCHPARMRNFDAHRRQGPTPTPQLSIA